MFVLGQSTALPGTFHFRQTHRVVDLANFESIYIFLGILLAAWMSVLNYYFDFTLYILALVGTLVLAFTSRPPGTYETVHWTTFIPHI